MRKLQRAMRRTNGLLKAQLADIQRSVDDGYFQMALRRKLHGLLRCELDDRVVRTSLLMHMTDLLARLGPNAATTISGFPRRSRGLALKKVSHRAGGDRPEDPSPANDSDRMGPVPRFR